MKADRRESKGNSQITIVAFNKDTEESHKSNNQQWLTVISNPIRCENSIDYQKKKQDE